MTETKPMSLSILFIYGLSPSDCPDATFISPITFFKSLRLPNNVSKFENELSTWLAWDEIFYFSFEILSNMPVYIEFVGFCYS